MKKNALRKNRSLRRASMSRSLANTRGMTLVEIMIVLLIITSIMGVVGVYVFGALDKANISESRIEILKLGGIVETYYLTSSPRGFPNTLDDLTKGASPLTKKIPNDPWGNPYIYQKISNREFEIHSAGPDGIEGNADDVHAEEGEN